MNNEIVLNNIIYTFKETFDVNLLLSYENGNWGEWEISREFISNALDSVCNDTSKVDIIKSEMNYLIHDKGSGYQVFFAKRIGASNKKDDPNTIGMFGEGTKLAILTCVRKNIEIRLCSQNWLIIPYAKNIEGQEVLFYDIYESDLSIEGSIVSIERNPNIDEVFNNLGDYFLAYNGGCALHGDTNTGIYPDINGNCKLYNKGVYIKNINALYSYAVNMEEINRDRNLISNDDLAYKIRDIYETVTDVDIIISVLKASAAPYELKKKLIEFEASFYSSYPEFWKESFQKLFGYNALIGTNEIASREAECLGYTVVTGLDFSIIRILKEAGIREDVNCLAEDFEFVWANALTRSEKEILEELPRYAKIAGFENLPESIRVFEEYRNHDNINGLYNSEKEEIYIKRKLLSEGIEKALKTYIHESTHHVARCDDLDRMFADTLCNKLTEMLIRYSSDVGVEKTARLAGNVIELPQEINLAAKDLTAYVSVTGNACVVSAGYYSIKINLKDYICPITLKKKILVKNDRFTFVLPDRIAYSIKLDEEGCFKCFVAS